MTIISRKNARWLKTLDDNGKEVNLCRRATQAPTLRAKTLQAQRQYARSASLIGTTFWWKYRMLYHHQKENPVLSVGMLKTLARDISNSLYDATHKPTGMVSIEALQQFGFQKSKYTSEHFYARQGACEYIIEQMYEKGDSFTFLHFVEILSKIRQVHWTTSDENMRLIPFQKANKNTVFDWEHTYVNAGILLVNYNEAKKLGVSATILKHDIGARRAA